ncbi:MAG: MauE/DoxX family redox-associated membrane protein [Actinomycetota bacterium]
MILALIAEALVYRVLDGLVALAPVAGLLLAAVFALAAATKAVDHGATTSEFAALGLPRPALLARIVPPAEVGIAVALVARPAAGALLATLALLAFSAVLIAALRTGRSVSCGCLGALSREPVSVTTLVRNAGFLALAALAATGPTPTGLSVALPSLELGLTTGTALLLALLSHQLLALRAQIGRLWSVELAGEAPTRGRGRSGRARTDLGSGPGSRGQVGANQVHAGRAMTNGVVS